MNGTWNSVKASGGASKALARSPAAVAAVNSPETVVPELSVPASIRSRATETFVPKYAQTDARHAGPQSEASRCRIVGGLLNIRCLPVSLLLFNHSFRFTAFMLAAKKEIRAGGEHHDNCSGYDQFLFHLIKCLR